MNSNNTMEPISLSSVDLISSNRSNSHNSHKNNPNHNDDDKQKSLLLSLSNDNGSSNRNSSETDPIHNVSTPRHANKARSSRRTKIEHSHSHSQQVPPPPSYPYYGHGYPGARGPIAGYHHPMPPQYCYPYGGGPSPQPQPSTGSGENGNNNRSSNNSITTNPLPPYYPMPGYHAYPPPFHHHPPTPYSGYVYPSQHHMHQRHSHSTSFPISTVSRSFDKGSNGHMSASSGSNSQDDEQPNKKSRSSHSSGRDEAPCTASPQAREPKEELEDQDSSSTEGVSLLLGNSNSFNMDQLLPRRMNCSSLDSLSDVASIQEPLAVTDTNGVSDASELAVKAAQKHHMKKSNSSKRPFSSTTSAFKATTTSFNRDQDEQCKEHERSIKYNSSPLSIRSSRSNDHSPRAMLEIPAIPIDCRDSFSRDRRPSIDSNSLNKFLAPKPLYSNNAALYFKMSYDDENDTNESHHKRSQEQRPGSSMSNSVSLQSSVALRFPSAPSCSWEMGSSSDIIGVITGGNGGLLPSFSFTNESQSGFLDPEARQKSHSFDMSHESASQNNIASSSNTKTKGARSDHAESSKPSNISSTSSSSKNRSKHCLPQTSNKPSAHLSYYHQPHAYYGYPHAASNISPASYYPSTSAWYPSVPGSTSKAQNAASTSPIPISRNESRSDRDSPVTHPQAQVTHPSHAHPHSFHTHNSYNQAVHYPYDQNYAAFCPPPVELPRHGSNAQSTQHRVMSQSSRHHGDAVRVMPPTPNIGGVYNWSKDEDIRLTTIMKKCRSFSQDNDRDNWDAIAKEHGRHKSGKECHERWIRYLKPGVRKGQWQDCEDAIVVEAVTTSTEQPFTRWSDLAQRLPGRVGKQIRDRWVNHLNPHINHLPFCKEDDRLLYKGYLDLGKKWVDISAKYFHGTRSENHIKNRWYSASFKKFITQEFGPEAYTATSKNNGSSMSISPNDIKVKLDDDNTSADSSTMQQPAIIAT